ncbi:MAG TPA: hypothetical protein VFA38_10615 [Nitrospirales bacterium]|nr:hypothetical protein [Nitrospirales bacterium]
MRLISLYGLIAVIIIGVYLVDVQTALGFTPWLFYLVPIGLTYLLPQIYGPVAIASVCAALLYIGFLMSPPGVPERFALANRSMGAVIFLLAAVFLTRYKELNGRLREATDQLAAELKERTRDLGLAVRDLRRAVDDRYRAEQGVRDAWAEVDQRVQERMHTLTEVNVSLREKIALLESAETRLTGRGLGMAGLKADLDEVEAELRRLNEEPNHHDRA